MRVELIRNKESSVSEEQINALAMSLYYSMLEYFQSEEGKAEYAEFLALQEEQKAA